LLNLKYVFLDQNRDTIYTDFTPMWGGLRPSSSPLDTPRRTGLTKTPCYTPTVQIQKKTVDKDVGVENDKLEREVRMTCIS
jgi:hypothetical protein